MDRGPAVFSGCAFGVMCMPANATWGVTGCKGDYNLPLYWYNNINRKTHPPRGILTVSAAEAGSLKARAQDQRAGEGGAALGAGALFLGVVFAHR